MNAPEILSEPSENPSASVHALHDKSKSSARSSPKRWPDETWDAVRRDYRTGTTYGKLSETYSIPVEVILRKKQAEGWTRDLRNDVQLETFARLAVGTESGDSKIVGDEEIIAAAAQRGAKVVTRHRKALEAHISGLQAVAEACNRIIAAVQAGEEPRASDLAVLPKGNVAAVGYVLQQVGNALARTVPLERKAFGLDDQDEEAPYEERLRQWHAQRKAEAASGG